jgi:hypothetical protein
VEGLVEEERRGLIRWKAFLKKFRIRGRENGNHHGFGKGRFSYFPYCFFFIDLCHVFLFLFDGQDGF